MTVSVVSCARRLSVGYLTADKKSGEQGRSRREELKKTRCMTSSESRVRMRGMSEAAQTRELAVQGKRTLE